MPEHDINRGLRKGYPPVVTVANHKGGVHKTTLTTVTSQTVTYLQEKMPEMLPSAFRSKPVLNVDIDPQGNLTELCGHDPVQLNITVKDFLDDTAKTPDLIKRAGILQTKFKNIHIIPSAITVESYSEVLKNQIDAQFRLFQVIEQLSDIYSLVVIDTPPNLQIFTHNAIVAATHVLIPVTNKHSTMGAPNIVALTNQARRLNNSLHPTLTGFIYTGLDKRVNYNKSLLLSLKQELGDLLFDVIVPTLSRLTENISRHRHIFYQMSITQKNVLIAFVTELFYRMQFFTYDEYTASLDVLGYEPELYGIDTEEYDENMEPVDAGTI